MSLDHDFMLAESGTTAGIGPVALLHDDLVRYLADALSWIPTFNPSKREPQCGLNMWGRTAIGHDGAAQAAAVFRAWAHLFSLAPDRLQLTGSWETVAGTNDHGACARLVFDREAVRESPLQIAAMCDAALASDGQLWVLHQGV